MSLPKSRHKYLIDSKLFTNRLVYNSLMNENPQAQESIEKSQEVLKKTLGIVCGKWRLYIIFRLGTQARRYGELRRMIRE